MNDKTEMAVHVAITRALDEAGVKPEVLRGMCIVVGLEKFRDELALEAAPEAAQHDTARLAQAEARVAYFSKLLASFWRITPPDIKVPDGRTFEFIDPDPHRTLRVIRDAMTGAMAQLEVQQQLDPEVHARAILKATACDWLWIEAGAHVAELDGSFTLEQLEAVATLLRLGKEYKSEEAAL